jgi:hypothetical protein
VPSDYAAIKEENLRRYGTDIDRIGPMLLADRYDNRAHFIYELLQNAEDALRRRRGSAGPRSIGFRLSESELRVSHFGRPFDAADIRGICGIGQSTKPTELTAIGRFGIGFKSVSAFTAAPEVHSGTEHFAIDAFVWPRAISPRLTRPGETLFVFPFRPTDALAHAEIAIGLKTLGARTLLFLKDIEEVSWSVDGGASGIYVRGEPEMLAPGARQVALLGQDSEAPDTEETWLIFARDVFAPDGSPAGQVEIAFSLEAKQPGSFAVRRVPASTLVVFFPTIVPTNCGFLLQGPYRTTPSRDNVPRQDEWNQHLVRETSSLLVEALPTLRGLGLLTVDALRALPLDRSRFDEQNMLTPLFEATRSAFAAARLLPAFRSGHTTSTRARLARTKELRELFSPTQLGKLFDTPDDVHWLSDEITSDRTPELRQYLLRELQVPELDPERVLPRLTSDFLKAQPDAWIASFYSFLNGQPSLWQRGQLNDEPIIRLESGEHVAPWNGKLPQAFLPGEHASGFPTVRQAIANHPDARKFLAQLGLTEPDPVDDVVANILPRYQQALVGFSDEQYSADIRRILAAFGTDSKAQRDKLIVALRDAFFVMAVDTGSGATSIAKPGELYMATERLTELFRGVPGVLLVNDSYSCLRGEEMRKLLDACGAAQYLQPLDISHGFTHEMRREMRREAGQERCSSEYPIKDWTLRGLQPLLAALPGMDTDSRRRRSSLLWKALADVEDRRGSGTFVGEYAWFFHTRYSTSFDAMFVRQLNDTRWIPDANSEPQQPGVILFESLGWDSEPFLLTKIRFKPPIIDTLAKEAGLEPGLLDLLKKIGVTSEDELKARLKLADEPEVPAALPPSDGMDSNKPVAAATEDASPPEAGEPTENQGAEEAAAPARQSSNGSASGDGNRQGHTGSTNQAEVGDGRRPGPGSQPARNGSASGTRTFHSYVGVHADDREPDPDGLTREARLSLEEAAILAILAEEPRLLRTPTNNPGYDLIGPGADEQPDRRIEVKAMTRDLTSRPVGMTHAQFECAREHGAGFWLYVVEFADSPDLRHIVRIQNPAGKARTFTFDRGWTEIATASPPPDASHGK